MELLVRLDITVMEEPIVQPYARYLDCEENRWYKASKTLY